MYKYSLNLTGSKENKERFVIEIQKLGYKVQEQAYQNWSDTLCINTASNWGGCENGHYWSCSIVGTRDYTFNIDNPEEYNAALAIAAIRTEDEFFPGEIVIAKENEKYRNAQEGSVAIVTKDEAWLYVDWLSIIMPDKSVTYTNRIQQPTLQYNGGYNKAYFRKATPEEIINFYKTNKTVNKMADTKVLTGFRAKNTISDIAEAIVYINPKYALDDCYLYADKEYRREVTPALTVRECKRYPDFWEPIYEDPKPQSKTYTLTEGKSRGTVITVTRGSKRLQTNDGRYITSDDAQQILDDFDLEEETSTYNVCVDTVQIGCDESGINTSLNDIRSVLNLWRELNA